MKSWLFGICCFLIGITSVQAQFRFSWFAQQVINRLSHVVHHQQPRRSCSSSASSCSLAEAQEQPDSPQAYQNWLNSQLVRAFPDERPGDPTPRLLPVELFNHHQPVHLDELEETLIDDDDMNHLLYANSFLG